MASVVYDPAAQPVDPRDLAQIQFLKPGGIFHAADAASTIDRLFATGYYRDVQIDAEPSGGGVALRIVTQNAWFNGHISVEGKIKSPPGEAELADATRLDLGAEFREEDLAEARQNLSRLLERNGLYEYQLRLETADHAGTDQRDIRIILDAGTRAKYSTPAIQGEALLPEQTILRATGWKHRFLLGWRAVTQARTRSGILGVLTKYQKEDRLTAKVQAQTSTYDAATRTVKPELQITAGPKVDIRAAETKLSQRRLKKYVPVFAEQTVNRDLLVEGQRNLTDYFQSQGYYEVDVSFRERQDDPNHLTIEYVIARGKRYRLVNIQIRGNRYFTTADLRERMFLEPNSFLRFRHGRFSQAFLRRDEESIGNLYQSNGFRNVKVTSSVENDYKGKPGDVAVVITIEEGPQWLVSHLTFSGFENLSAASLRDRLASTEGEPFSEYNVAADRTAILTAYQSGGFPDAAFQWSFTPAGEPNHVDLNYSVSEGRREIVRGVILSGIEHTRRSLVERNMEVAADQPLSLVNMSSVQRNLYQLGIFSRIDMAVQNASGEAEYKNVLFDFHEASRYTLALGVGAEIARIGGTTTNLEAPAGSTGFSPRFSADLSRLNFLGLGHTISLRTRLSNLEQLASFNYLAPRFRNVEGRDITFTTLYDLQRNVGTFSSHREEASIQLSQRLSKPSTLLFRFAYRRVSTSDVVIPDLLIPQLLQPVRIGVLEANYIQDRRDDPVDAHRGIYNTADIGVATSIFGSQRSFLRGLFRNATYYSLTRDIVLARQTSFGVIVPFNIPPGSTSSTDVPLPERFFGGGNQTDRGFPENEAGPRDIGTAASPATGFPLGGNALFFNNVELRFPLIGNNIGGVAFWDAGNVYSTIGKLSFRVSQHNLQDFDYMVHAVGLGIRYRTPIGPVRADFAYSINPPSFYGFKGTVQQLLNCGPNGASCQPVMDSISHFQFFISIGQTF